MIYFDHAASSPLLDDVFQTLTKSQQSDFANPSAAHRAGRELLAKIETCRQNVLRDLTGNPFRPETLIFTSSATEANNHLVKTADFPATEIWCHQGDHPSLVAPARWRAERDGIPLRQIPLTPRGTFNWDQWFDTLKTSSTPLVLVTLVHNQTGVRFEWSERLSQIKEVCPGAFVHADAVQAYARYCLQKAIPSVDSLALSGHKIGGPKGIAGLFIKNPDQLGSLLDGGGHEGGKRSSTLSTPLIEALSSAVSFWSQVREREHTRTHTLAQKLREGLSALSKKLHFPFAPEDTCPHILGVVFENISSDIILRCLEERHVMISSASACSSKTKGRNPALDLLGWERPRQQSFFRISLGHTTTEKDVETLISAFDEVLGEISHLLPNEKLR